MTDSEQSPVAAIGRLMEEAGVSYAIIGGHAVNAWLEPRFTADIDVTVAADRDALARLEGALSKAGYTLGAKHGAILPSGPDFVRWTRSETEVVEMQLAKTDLQKEVIRRAARGQSGACIASKEDLIVLKLIADRAKDRIDLEGLCALEGVDWAYVEQWAEQWEVADRLKRFHSIK